VREGNEADRGWCRLVRRWISPDLRVVDGGLFKRTKLAGVDILTTDGGAVFFDGVFVRERRLAEAFFSLIFLVRRRKK
jgi:hypothetical protein